MSPKKKLLTSLVSKAYLVTKSRNVWLECMIVKHRFWKTATRTKETQLPCEQSSYSFGESTNPEHKTPFMDHKEGEGIFVYPRWKLKMRVGRVEVPRIELLV